MNWRTLGEAPGPHRAPKKCSRLIGVATDLFSVAMTSGSLCHSQRRSARMKLLKFGGEYSNPCLGLSSSPNRPRRRPYSRSEVIHRAGDESIFPAFERERPRIVNNFAASAPSGYELSSSSEKMNRTRLSNLAVVLESGNEYSDEDESSLRRLRLAIRNSHPAQAARTTSTPL